MIVECQRPDLIVFVGKYVSRENLGPFLLDAMLDENPAFMIELLLAGADPNSLPIQEVLSVTRSNSVYLELLLRCEESLSNQTLKTLTLEAIQSQNLEWLQQLLRKLYSSRPLNSDIAEEQNSYLEAALQAGNETVFLLIAVMTCRWPILNIDLLAKIRRSTSFSQGGKREVLEAFFCMLDAKFFESSVLALKTVYEDCARIRDVETVKVLSDTGYPIPFEAFCTVWESQDFELFQIFLQSRGPFCKSIWSLISLKNITLVQLRMYESVLSRAIEKSILLKGSAKTKLPSKDQRLLEAVKGQFVQLVSLLIQAGASVNYQNGYVLRVAFESKNEALIKTVIKEASAESIKRVLLSTTFLGWPNPQSISILLENCSSYRDVIALLLIVLYDYNSNVHTDEFIALLVLRIQQLSQSYDKSNSSPTKALSKFQLKRESFESHSFFSPKQRKNDEPGRDSSLPIWKSFLQYLSNQHILEAVEELPHSGGELAAFHLVWYVGYCMVEFSEKSRWPTTLFKILTAHAPHDHAHYLYSMGIVALSKQWQILDIFLSAQNSHVTSIQNLDLSRITLETGDIEELTNLFDKLFKDNSDFSKSVMTIFERVRQAKCSVLLGTLLKCLCSRAGLNIEYVLPMLLEAFSYTELLDSISTLLCLCTTVTQSHLEQFWDRVNLKTGQRQALLVLNAGYAGSKLETALVACADISDSVLVPSAILQALKVERGTRLGRRDRVHGHHQRGWEKRMSHLLQSGGLRIQTEPQMDVENINSSVHETLKKALSRAVQKQRIELCRLFLSSGLDVLTSDDFSALIGVAVQYGGSKASLNEDEILKLVIQEDKEGYEKPLNVALIEAIYCGRAILVKSLLSAGASMTVWDKTPCKVACNTPDSKVLAILLDSSTIHFELNHVVARVFDRPLEDGSQVSQWFYSLKMCIENRVANPRLHQVALSRLCSSEWVQGYHIERLVQLGVPVRGADSIHPWLCLENNRMAAFTAIYKACEFDDQCKFFESWCQTLACPSSPQYIRSILANRISDQLKVMYISRSQFDVMCAGFRSFCEGYYNEMSLWRSYSMPKKGNILEAVKIFLDKGANFKQEDVASFYWCHLIADDELRTRLQKQKPLPGLQVAALRLMLSKMIQDDSVSDTIISRTDFIQLFDNIAPDSTVTNGIFADSDMMHLFETLSSLRFRGNSSFVDHVLYTRRDLHPISGVCSEEVLRRLHNMLFVAIYLGAPQTHVVLEATQWRNTRTADSGNTQSKYYIGDQRVNELLGLAARQRKYVAVDTLLRLGADYRAGDGSGNSILFNAVSSDDLELARMICLFSRQIEEKSFLRAIEMHHCQILRFFMTFEHFDVKSWWCGCSFFPLFVRLDFSLVKEVNFRDLIEIIRLRDFGEVPAHQLWFSDYMIGVNLHTVLDKPHAFKLCAAFISFLQPSSLAVTDSASMIHARGRLRYSLPSLVEHWDEVNMSVEERTIVTRSLLDLGYNAVYYAEDGDQPPGAVGVPEHLSAAEEYRQRSRAWKTKTCSIYGEKIEREEDVYSKLVDRCATHHGWNDLIICREHLRDWLEGQMFADDGSGEKSRKFALTEVRCWSPKCHSTILTYNELQKLVDEDMFRDYDRALLNCCLRNNQTIVLCAKKGCTGVAWFDPDQDEDITEFVCTLCSTKTCTECNDLYSKHESRVCPAGKKAKNARLQREEELSEEVLKALKCPNPGCIRPGGIPYVKRDGCNEIVCGRDTDKVYMISRKSNAVSGV